MSSYGLLCKSLRICVQEWICKNNIEVYILLLLGVQDNDSPKWLMCLRHGRSLKW